MNPCINCTLDKMGCHSSGFADNRCEYWIDWKTELSIFKAQSKLDSHNLKKKIIKEMSLNDNAICPECSSKNIYCSKANENILNKDCCQCADCGWIITENGK